MSAEVGGWVLESQDSELLECFEGLQSPVGRPVATEPHGEGEIAVHQHHAELMQINVPELMSPDTNIFNEPVGGLLRSGDGPPLVGSPFLLRLTSI